ncbi:alpha-L-iduronidase [Contarinia nasturtii]|uniref:alpha-L-iduronidase n=1 Tax=Contarinia nasturtii TaxID=265458 RepID=UPI0012D3ED4B|nr:alpha-L-iduronidase [Contarinia nasturtii]
MHRNMEYISALPNSGIKHIRIHWLLSLIKFSGFDINQVPKYDFTALDTFLDHLMEIQVFPVIELMGDIFPVKDNIHGIYFMWKDFSFQLVSHYLTRYGQRTVLNFRFELWNEPDVLSYNILNYSLTDYLEYAYGVASGLKAGARRMNSMANIPLRGPAGLFKSIERHKLCYGLLMACNYNVSSCPIDVLTFHRKGDNSSTAILMESIELLDILREKYPNLDLPYANSEADPSSGWSKNVTLYADVNYAHTIVSIVLQHWNAILDGSLNRLESISHDNSFLSFHPFEFLQRTMLARFVMNNTEPKTVHFIQKPVYAALGMLSALAHTANKMETNRNVSYVLSIGEQYAAALLFSNKNTLDDHIDIKLDLNYWTKSPNATFGYFAEFLDQTRTNPHSIWTYYKNPPYPNETVFAEMMHAQGPHVLQNPKIVENQSFIKLAITFNHPWIVLVRICAASISKPQKVKNVRIRSIDKNKILILWNDYEYSNNERCIRTYEIYYAAVAMPENTDHQMLQWQLITSNKHIPFLSYCHQISTPNEHFAGYYKIRAIDIFGRYSEFSKIYKYKMKSKQSQLT